MTTDRQRTPEGPTPDLDRLSLARAVAYGQLLAIPAALANVALADQDPKPKGALNLTFLVLLLAFAIAGIAAGRNAHRNAARQGAIAAAIAFVPAQLIGIVGRLDRGDGLSIASIIVVGLLAACAGAIGGQLGARRRSSIDARGAASAPSDEPTDPPAAWEAP